MTGSYDSDDENYNLEFLVDPSTTRMFSPLGDDAQIYAKKNITYNHHTFGIKPDLFKTDTKLAAMFTPTSVSYDNNGKAFVASMESKKYPFFGTQFHPEKQQFSYYPSVKIEHDPTSIFYNRYFGDFFVNQCRMNKQKFKNYAEEQSRITENFTTIVTKGYDGIDFVFSPSDSF